MEWVGIVGGSIGTLTAVMGSLWALVVFVFQPRMEDTIVTTIKTTVNGKIDRLDKKADDNEAAAQQRHLDMSVRLATADAERQSQQAQIDKLDREFNLPH